jgi:AbrB family looped-hinge helix DNA binding protein
MKRYQVTKKLQVTIPKKLADKTGIRPGDSVVFEESGEAITLRRAGRAEVNPAALRLVIEDMARDMERVGPRAKEAERALNENLSRHLA